KIIDSDLRVMIDEVMPLNEVVMRMDGATERFVSGILDMERARTAEELAAAKTRVGKERTSLKSLLDQGAALDGSLSAGARELDRFETRISEFIEQRMQARKSDDGARDDASRNMQRTRSMLPRVEMGFGMLKRQKAAAVDAQSQEIASLVRAQRDVLTLQVLIKDAQVIVYALQGLTDFGGIKSLKQRSAALAARMSHMMANAGTAAVLGEAGITGNPYQTWIVDDADGLIALRVKAFGADEGARKRFEARSSEFLGNSIDWLRKIDGAERTLAEKIDENQKKLTEITGGAGSGADFATELAEIQQLMTASENALSDVFVTVDPGELERNAGILKQSLDSLSKHLEAAGATFKEQGFVPFQMAAQRLSGSVSQWSSAVASIVAARHARFASEAELDKELDGLRAFVLRKRTDSAKTITELDKHQDEIAARADRSVGRAFIVQWSIALLAAVTLGILGFRLIRSIRASLEQAIALVQEIADGRLRPVRAGVGEDEIGQLVDALGSMVERLRVSVTRIRESAGSVRRSVNEISRGNVELTERTNEQASSLHETAASMNQVAEIARSGATAADTAAKRSRTANEAAGKGRQTMSEATQSMNSVQNGAEEIKNIIEVINSIAFQTNILALNASVEAARAGPQGRGFAVVAAEVRSLASRSASAAQEIDSIITNSVAQVESGSALVHDAGKRIEEIAGEVSQTVEMIQQISAGSMEQASAISQANQAIQLLEESTQMGATLAEQIAQSTTSLVEQAQILEDSVALFQVEEA
ncbi:MAG: methyl-accepting chemotaxis protein, partial [Burkholderiaceae bacterium]